MLLWIVLALGWIGVLLLAISLFRITTYAEKKIRDKSYARCRAVP